MHQFLTAMRESTIPAPVKEAAMANLSTLATPTCFRTADGKFRGFEGINDDRGCCHGNCTHVWNYETTTQYLFPSLARSMREAAFDLAERLDGMLPIRMSLPEGKQTGGITAADGTMGQIIKTYVDWQLSGDLAWLDQIWPKVKKALEFAWVEGGWDGDRDGVMEGVQHNTYDVEFYGPNPMCGVYYLGALRAAEEMARPSEIAICRRVPPSVYERKQWIDAEPFQRRILRSEDPRHSARQNRQTATFARRRGGLRSIRISSLAKAAWRISSSGSTWRTLPGWGRC